MPDLVGPIQPLELASWLWLILFFPLAGALTNALYSSGFAGQLVHAIRFGLADDDAAKPKPFTRVVAPARTSATIAVGSLALTVIAAVIHGVLLVQRPAGERFLVEPLWQLVRVGQLDVNAGLAFDTLAAGLVVLVSVVGTVLCVSAARSDVGASAGSSWRFFACFGGLVFFLLLVLLADNLLLVLVGWEGVGLSGLGLVAPRAKSGSQGLTAVFLAQRAGEAGLVLGVVLLFWGLGGTWAHDEAYQSDLDPRVAAVSVIGADEPAPSLDDPALRGAVATKGKGFLTVSGLPGALVYMDDSRSPILGDDGVPLTTPFHRHEVDGGSHAFRIAPDDRFRTGGGDPKVAYVLEGGALANYSVGRTAFGGGREVALTIVGPTLEFREMEDELLVSGVKGGRPIRERFLARKLSGVVGVATLACLLILLGAGAKSAEPLLGGEVSGDAGRMALLPTAGMVLAGAYLMARLWFLFSLSPVAKAVLELVGVCVALLIGSVLVRRSRARAR
jgi:NADH-quinone oxidoreductase subunit L